jgi:hypothetical protein
MLETRIDRLVERFFHAPAKIGIGVLLAVLACPEIGQAVAAQTPAAETVASGSPGLLAAKQWSPYVAGLCIGILSWITFVLSDHPIGVSSAVARTSGMIERMARGPGVEEKPYYKELGLGIGWEWTFVAGIVLGSLGSAALSGDFQLRMIPSLWGAAFGDTPFLRWLTAFFGGMVLMVGARWAGGCTSGHGISGTLQLVVSSWIALMCFFIGGVVTAFLFYGA